MTVHFYQPDSFLRTWQKTNPFLDPIIKVCEKNNIGYKIFLPHCPSDIGYRKSVVFSTSWISVIGNVIWKMAKIFGFRNAPAVYFAYARVLRMVTKKRHTADIVISCGAALGYVLSRLYPDSRVVDLQHGVIYSRHSGYFDSTCRLTNLLQHMPNREFWVYGRGYAECFFKHPDNIKDLQRRVKIIGDVVRAWEGENKEGRMKKEDGSGARNLVVFSAQLTADLAREEMVASVNRMEEFFDEFFKKFGDRYECLVKHHPRFANVYDMTGFFAKFPQLKETKERWAELYPRMVLHVTFMSTVTFDCASAGVPTYLLDFPAAKILKRDLFRDDYEYPYFGKTVEEILAIPVEEARKAMLRWYRRFYTPFREENCLQLLTGKDSDSLNESAKEC